MTSLEGIIKSCSYKPGWSFDYEPGVHPFLLITARVPNSRGPGEIEFTIKRLIPDDTRTLSAAQVCNWVKTMVIEAEVHEVREFFKYQGVVVDDPHQLRIIPPPDIKRDVHAVLRGSGEWPR
jgi:hypothetical protein